MAFPSDRGLRAYRIASSRFPVFDGEGASRFGGRWTSPGCRVIYAARCYSGALLEALVHLAFRGIPRDYIWIGIEAADDVSVDEVTSSQLDFRNPSACREFGDRWYRERRTAVLLVPSIPSDGLDQNVVINQEHPDFALLRAGKPKPVIWDSRLFTTAAR